MHNKPMTFLNEDIFVPILLFRTLVDPLICTGSSCSTKEDWIKVNMAYLNYYSFSALEQTCTSRLNSMCISPLALYWR